MDDERTRRDGRRRSSDELWAGLVAEVAVMPDVVANLLREHQPDEQGFCTGNGCGTAGRGVPTTRWPCALHSLATEARSAGATVREERFAPETRPTEEATAEEATAAAPSTAEATAAPPTARDDRPISTAAAWLIRRR